MEISTSMVRSLMRSGNLAAEHNFHPEAIDIFNGVCAARPNSEIPLLGLAMVLMNTGKADEAIEVLQNKALKISPDNQICKTFLGIAMNLKGQKQESDVLFDEVIEQNSDPHAVKLATATKEQGDVRRSPEEANA